MVMVIKTDLFIEYARNIAIPEKTIISIH